MFHIFVVGSGAMATLVQVMNLAELCWTSTYEIYRYRIRFCWWRAEENGMRGSYHHTEEANIITIIQGHCLQNYVLKLNFDMSASLNSSFGIYESDTLLAVFQQKCRVDQRRFLAYFSSSSTKNHCHGTGIHLECVSDHVPCLVGRVACSGTFSGADDLKTMEQCDGYAAMVGYEDGGSAHAKYDPCYHQSCDTIDNIDPDTYEIMVKVAVHSLEALARTPHS